VEAQHLEDLIDRVIEDVVPTQDQKVDQVFHHQLVMNWKQQQEQQLLLVHEIVVE
jgi:hypothetical protein